MDKQTPDFWAMEDRRLLERWPKTSDGQPQPAAKLAIQWELDSMADITLSLLESCGIPAFKSGSLGKVLGGFCFPGGRDLGPRRPAGRSPGSAGLLCRAGGTGLIRFSESPAFCHPMILT